MHISGSPSGSQQTMLLAPGQYPVFRVPTQVSIEVSMQIPFPESHEVEADTVEVGTIEVGTDDARMHM